MRPFEVEQKLFNRTALEDESILSGQFWGELRIFLAVAKARSFNRAAEMLNMSQPTVSRQVKRLQDLVGSQLFVYASQANVVLARHLWPRHLDDRPPEATGRAAPIASSAP